MCTVTIVPLEDGYRLMCNRDEQHTRPAALPPRRLSIDGGQATMPIDPQGGGSWIAVTDGGLTIAMLNRMPLRAPAAPGALLLGQLVGAEHMDAGLGEQRFERDPILLLLGGQVRHRAVNAVELLRRA